MASVIQEKEVSTIFTLHWVDIAKGLLMAVIGAVVGFLYAGFNAGHLDFTAETWQTVAKLAIGSAVTYLMKQFVSGPVIPAETDTTVTEPASK